MTRVVVVGGGRMGLPLSAMLASNGADVVVCDINANVVSAVNAGIAPYEEPGLSERVAAGVADGRLQATGDTTQAVGNADVVIIIVPAHLTPEKSIDYSILLSASDAVGRGLQPGTLVSYETTVAVGGTRSTLIPALETASGLVAGRDFDVVHSPERVKANRVFERLQETPKVVGGFNEKASGRAAAFYGKYLRSPVIDVETLEAAELTKLAGMIYRDVNIALANELALYAEAVGVDFELVRPAANTNGEAHLLIPGIGVGGHCTPVYPNFVIGDARDRGTPQLIAENARLTNDSQPERQIDRLETSLGSLEGRNVRIMGLSFRPDVKVAEFNTAAPIRDALERRGARVSIDDPMYSAAEIETLGFRPVESPNDRVDAIVLNTAHSAFSEPDLATWQQIGVRAVVDGRRMWTPALFAESGIDYIGVGLGSP